MDDLGQELAVTKNDIKHLENDIGEIKMGIEKIHSSISGVYGRMDEKFVRKDEFEKHVTSSNTRLEKISGRSNMILGAVITLLTTAMGLLIVELVKMR